MNKVSRAYKRLKRAECGLGLGRAQCAEGGLGNANGKVTKGVKLAECGLGRAQYTESGLMREKMAGLTSLAEMFSRQTLPHYNS